MHFKPEFNSPLFNGAQMTFRSLEALQRLGEQNVSFMGQMKLLILLEYLLVLSFDEINAMVWNQGILYRDVFND